MIRYVNVTFTLTLRLRYVTLHYVTLRYITLHYVTLHYVQLRYDTLHYVTLRYVTLRYVTLRYVQLRYITLRYVTLRYITLRSVTLRYVTLRYVMCFMKMCAWSFAYKTCTHCYLFSINAPFLCSCHENALFFIVWMNDYARIVLVSHQSARAFLFYIISWKHMRESFFFFSSKCAHFHDLLIF